MTSSQTTEESGQEGENPPNDSLPKRTDYLPEKRDELATVVQQLEEVIRIKELCIDRLTKELNDARDQSALLEGQSAKSLDLKEDRIEELEEALRESVRITADREVALDAETQHRTILDQKVGQLEQRLQSMHNAKSLKCHQCRPNRLKLQELQSRLSQLLAERRGHLHELFDMKQEALEAAISERDAQLGLLEVSGIKTARAAERADDLRADRKRLMQMMKQQNEKRVKLLLEYEDESLIAIEGDDYHATDSTEDSDDPVCK